MPTHFPTHFSSKLINSGRDGSVYTGPQKGLVIKVTRCKIEACVAYAIRDLQREGVLGNGFPCIDSIWEENGVYFTQREDVPADLMARTTWEVEEPETV